MLATHDARVAASADRVIQLRNGLIADDTRLDAGASTATVVSTLLRLEI